MHPVQTKGQQIIILTGLLFAAQMSQNKGYNNDNNNNNNSLNLSKYEACSINVLGSQWSFIAGGSASWRLYLWTGKSTPLCWRQPQRCGQHTLTHTHSLLNDVLHNTTPPSPHPSLTQTTPQQCTHIHTPSPRPHM